MSASHLSMIILCIPHPVEEHNPQLALKGTTANTAETKRTSLSLSCLKVNSTAETHRWCLDYRGFGSHWIKENTCRSTSKVCPWLFLILTHVVIPARSKEIASGILYGTSFQILPLHEFLARGLFFLCP